LLPVLRAALQKASDLKVGSLAMTTRDAQVIHAEEIRAEMIVVPRALMPKVRSQLAIESLRLNQMQLEPRPMAAVSTSVRRVSATGRAMVAELLSTE
jgi:hypothetical protein